MATLYNKTALKKIRKKELVQMFLDKQAREINYSMEDEIEELKEECAEGLIPHGTDSRMKDKAVQLDEQFSF
jgi:hypothetical protein